MNTFAKNTKLCGQERISHLYKVGHNFVAWPVRVTWMPTENDTQVLVWAPKSLFKHAVDRNHLRRLMREAYRLNQHLLGSNHYLIAFNYIDQKMQSYSVITRAMRKSLTKIVEHDHQ